MSDDLIFDHMVLQPSEAEELRAATRIAMTILGSDHIVTGPERERLASDVIRVAKSGFTRSATGTFDPRSVAQAAAVRFKAFT